MLQKGLITIGMLMISNVFMTLAWYAHLKLSRMKVISNWPLWMIILFSWSIALLEYSFMIPATRIGFSETGGPFSLVQLRVVQEVISLTTFSVFVLLYFKNQPLRWNHFAAFACMVAAVFFVFLK